ncbi:MAG: hypothetical protein ACREXW_02085 [Gammaproteobacteria bacterium]
MTGGFRLGITSAREAHAGSETTAAHLAAVAELCVDVVGGHEGKPHCGVEYTPEGTPGAHPGR